MVFDTMESVIMHTHTHGGWRVKVVFLRSVKPQTYILYKHNEVTRRQNHQTLIHAHRVSHAQFPDMELHSKHEQI